MKLEFKGILEKVFPAETLNNEKKTKKVIVQVLKPARRDEFGQEVGYDDHFELSVYNDKISEDFLKSLTNEKVEVTGYLNTFEYTSNNETRHGLSINLNKIEKFQPKSQGNNEG